MWKRVKRRRVCNFFRKNFLQQILHTPLICSSWLETWSHMNSCLKQDNAASLSIFKGAAAKSRANPLSDQRGKIAVRSRCIPILSQPRLSISLITPPPMTNQKAGTAYFIFFAYTYVAGERFSELV